MAKKTSRDRLLDERSAALQGEAIAKGGINLFIRSFGQREVLELVVPKLNAKRLQRWLDRGVFSIGGPTGRGSGFHRQWCGLEIIQLQALATLLAHLALPVSQAARLAEMVSTRAQEVVSPEFHFDERGMMVIRGVPTGKGIRYDLAYEGQGDVAQSLRGMFAGIVIRPDVLIIEVCERLQAYLASREGQHQ